MIYLNLMKILTKLAEKNQKICTFKWTKCQKNHEYLPRFCMETQSSTFSKKSKCHCQEEVAALTPDLLNSRPLKLAYAVTLDPWLPHSNPISHKVILVNTCFNSNPISHKVILVNTCFISNPISHKVILVKTCIESYSTWVNTCLRPDAQISGSWSPKIAEDLTWTNSQQLTAKPKWQSNHTWNADLALSLRRVFWHRFWP